MFRMVAMLLVLCCLAACAPQNTESEKVEEPAYFDGDSRNQAFKKLPKTERGAFFLNVINHQYTNQEAVEGWLIAQLPALIEAHHTSDDKQLREILLPLYASSFDKASFEFAKLIQEKSLQQNGEAEPYSCAVLAYHYGVANQKDSVEKYFQFFNDPEIYESNSWLWLEYLSTKGNLHRFNGNYFEAAVCYHDAINKLTPANDNRRLVFHHNLSMLYLEMKILDKAKFHAGKAMESSIIHELSAYELTNYGMVFSNIGEYERADTLFQMSAAKAIDENLNRVLARVYSSFGNLKRKQKDFEQALHYMALSDSICDATEMQVGKVFNQINRAELFYEKGNFDHAENLLLLIEPEVKSYNLPKLTMEINKLLFRIYDSLGDDEKANLYYRLYDQEKDALFGDLPRSIISEWELLNERKVYLEETNMLLTALERKEYNNYFLAFIFTLILFVIAVFYFIRKRKTIIERERIKLVQCQLSSELELKSKELLSENLKILKIQSIKSELLNELDELLIPYPKNEQARFSRLKQKLKAEPPKMVQVEFDKRFLGVHDKFYQELLQKAPDLSSVELKICALIRLNHTSKEISILTNRSLKTVENTRFNIRKKLNLATDNNLFGVLMRI